ncbi:MAG: 5'-methylthioadenosine/S-adenosylhomocysteine nucleosidase [Oscillibacter sp.]|nr:5'-methylthioadenosine/S-adenosylhomocysteine nucleosidase [Oscillibacter sp.]
MKIGMQFAMPAELHALPGARELTPFETVSGVPFYQVGPGLTACAGGVSKVNAAMAAEILCLKYGVDLILNAGVAGCTSGLPTGSLVVASEFLQHDVDTTAVGDPIGLVSTVNRVEFPTWAPERCAALLRELGFDAVTGRVATGDWFAVGSPRAEWVRDTFSPLLVEMEGCAIAQVCLRNNVRFVSVKSVSDHLFQDRAAQAEEYFDFGQALEALGRAVLPLAKKLQEES